MKYIILLNTVLGVVNLYFFTVTSGLPSYVSLGAGLFCLYSSYINRGLLTSKGEKDGI